MSPSPAEETPLAQAPAVQAEVRQHPAIAPPGARQASVTTPTQSRVDRLRTQLRDMQRQLQQLAGHRGAPTPGRRPDGTLVSPGPEVHQVKQSGGRIVAQATAPVKGALNAIYEHWEDSVREAKLAAKEKETDMRADYERRVQHDAHWHAEQHNRH